MVDGREIDRAQHAVGHIGRSGNLQKMAAAAIASWRNVPMAEAVQPTENPGASQGAADRSTASGALCMRSTRHPTDARIERSAPVSDVPSLSRSALAQRLRRESGRRGAVRRVFARTLQHRCVDLPDRAGRRGGAAHAKRPRASRMQIAREEGVPILPRGAGTSQCGQTVGAALVIDCSKYLNAVVEFDARERAK